MLFNSLEFVVFLVVVLIGHYWLIPRRAVRGRKIFLLVASYAFYAAWNPFFSLLLAFSTVVDYSVGLAIVSAIGARRRVYVIASLVANLGLLGFFKYGLFATESVYALAGRTLTPGEIPWLEVALPVGISFYTFQSLSYTLDVYRRTQAPTRSLLDFALYVSFFPQLVAGPIVRAKDLLGQLSGQRRVVPEDFEQGLARVATGLAKKVLLADTIGAYVDDVYGDPGAYGGIEMALAIYGFAFQIFFDFAGYCDIAIGVARMLGVRLPENFDRPYRSLDVQEFWRRWHITLSTWLRDYLYISLGGNRKGPSQARYREPLRDDAARRVVARGWLELRAVGRLSTGRCSGSIACRSAAPRPPPSRIPAWLRRFATFHLVCAGWVLFRSPDLETVRLGRVAAGVPPSRDTVGRRLRAGRARPRRRAGGACCRDGQPRAHAVAGPVRAAFVQGLVYAALAWDCSYFTSDRTA